MGALWEMALFVYNSDDGNTYNVALREEVGTAGNFNPAASGAVANYPKQYRKRYVTGIDLSTGDRHVQPIASASDPIFVSAATFVYNGVTYSKVGSVAEKRPTRL